MIGQTLVRMDRGWPLDAVTLGDWIRYGGGAGNIVAIGETTVTDDAGSVVALEDAQLAWMPDAELAASNLGFPRETVSVHLGLYRVTRHFGGREEGGWWYDRKRYLGDSRQTTCMEARAARDAWEMELQPDQPQYDRYSVLGDEGDLAVYIELEPGSMDDSKEPRPHYE